MVERVTRKNENLESELPLTISAQYGLIDQNEFFDKRIASRDVSGYYLLKKGEFAYNKSTSSDAPWGAVKRLDRYEMGVLSTLYIVFALKEDGNIDSDFLVSYYDTDCWHMISYSWIAAAESFVPVRHVQFVSGVARLLSLPARPASRLAYFAEHPVCPAWCFSTRQVCLA